MRVYFIFILIILICLSCSENNKGATVMLDKDFVHELKLLKDKRIYFGHQSVGKNIMQGLTDLISMQSEIEFPIIDLTVTDSLPDHYFARFRLGGNTDPKGKCDAFASFINNIISDSPDIALMKFCYVDITEETDVKALFNYYRETISKIKEKYPDLILMHVTVPLLANSGGWKIKVKRLIKYQDYTDPANIKRNEFNNLLLETYKNEPVFDLARVESTYPDGKRESFKNNGKTYYSLIKDYAYDEGHLNATGSQLAAREMIRSIARVFNYPSGGNED